MFKELAYYDGVYGTPEDVKVPFNDRVHFFGDGVYDATVSFMTQKLTLEADDARFDEIVEQAAAACKKVDRDCVLRR